MQVDCTAEVELCREHQITGFPSIRVFRAGKSISIWQVEAQPLEVLVPEPASWASDQFC